MGRYRRYTHYGGVTLGGTTPEESGSATTAESEIKLMVRGRGRKMTSS
jgi:hypothetical protein